MCRSVSIPPTLQLLIFGLALSPDVNQISLGVLDQARSNLSRELVANLVTGDIFQVAAVPDNQTELTQAVRTGEVTAGLIVPADFPRQLQSGKTADIQVFIDGIDANTAGIARGYLEQMTRSFSQRFIAQQDLELPIETEITFLYNPGLIASWFFVPGVMGVVITLTGSSISAVASIREKDTGTLEQLLMTPAAGWEILLAKIVPLFVLLMGDVLLASSLGWAVFNLPFRGNFLLFLALSAVYVFVCIGLGLLLATLSATQQQVILTSFFFNVPIIQLSGAIAPIESMPLFFRILSTFDPLRHYVAIARSLILKGVGLEGIWLNAIALFLFAIGLLAVSANRFRSQLG